MKVKIVATTVALGVGALLGSFLVGRAQAQQPQPYPMPRWQYTCITQVSSRFWAPEVLNKMNEMGSQGWQLLAQRNGINNADVYCFERRY
jgi:hypothetical protein